MLILLLFSSTLIPLFSLSLENQQQQENKFIAPWPTELMCTPSTNQDFCFTALSDDLKKDIIINYLPVIIRKSQSYQPCLDYCIKKVNKELYTLLNREPNKTFFAYELKPATTWLIATRSNNIERLDILVNNNKTNFRLSYKEDGKTVLFYAIKNGYLPIIIHYLKNGYTKLDHIAWYTGPQHETWSANIRALLKYVTPFDKRQQLFELFKITKSDIETYYNYLDNFYLTCLSRLLTKRYVPTATPYTFRDVSILDEWETFSAQRQTYLKKRFNITQEDIIYRKNNPAREYTVLPH